MTGICKWLSVKSHVFQAPRALWDRVAKGTLVGATEICELSTVVQTRYGDPVVPFQECFQPFAFTAACAEG